MKRVKIEFHTFILCLSLPSSILRLRLNFIFSVRFNFYTQFLKFLNVYHLTLNFASIHNQQFSTLHYNSIFIFHIAVKTVQNKWNCRCYWRMFLWWLAKIIKFNGEWEVVVRWIEFGNRKSKITIPSTVRKTSEKWNIRKTKVTPQTLPSQRSRDNEIQLVYRAKFQSRGDTKKFLQGETVQKGFVFINGSVLQEMEIPEEHE